MKKTLITIELFLILLVALLFAFLLFMFTNKKIENEDSAIPAVSVDTTEIYCGITVTEPKIDSVVSTPFVISGYVSGCGWEPYRNYVASLRLYDDKNNLISRPYLVNKNGENTSPVSTQFSMTIENLPVQDGKVRAVFNNYGIIEKEYILPFSVKANSVDENVQ